MKCEENENAFHMEFFQPNCTLLLLLCCSSMLTLKNAQVLSGGVGGGQRFLLLATVGWGEN